LLKAGFNGIYAELMILREQDFSVIKSLLMRFEIFAKENIFLCELV
jgi:hypothetical protein